MNRPACDSAWLAAILTLAGALPAVLGLAGLAAADETVLGAGALDAGKAPVPPHAARTVARATLVSKRTRRDYAGSRLYPLSGRPEQVLYRRHLGQQARLVSVGDERLQGPAVSFDAVGPAIRTEQSGLALRLRAKPG